MYASDEQNKLFLFTFAKVASDDTNTNRPPFDRGRMRVQALLGVRQLRLLMEPLNTTAGYRADRNAGCSILSNVTLGRLRLPGLRRSNHPIRNRALFVKRDSTYRRADWRSGESEDSHYHGKASFYMSKKVVSCLALPKTTNTMSWKKDIENYERSPSTFCRHGLSFFPLPRLSEAAR
ncbi:uncharacterized protein LOC131677870 [Topomyia yanbarensis]|uniref:uncharacterized protein LOC131677870 n=1 Tax=Topomyia yanbarensis TaxID=2498891 RepID=UPI00273C1799|nr:uncharacterized protein LOC131677870 [Topomyia yanbarensis]